MENTKLALSKAFTLANELDSMLLIVWNSAEHSTLGIEAYADVLSVMFRMSTDLVSILKEVTKEEELK